jgi:hypothetical protein
MLLPPTRKARSGKKQLTPAAHGTDKGADNNREDASRCDRQAANRSASLSAEDIRMNVSTLRPGSSVTDPGADARSAKDRGQAACPCQTVADRVPGGIPVT